MVSSDCEEAECCPPSGSTSDAPGLRDPKLPWVGGAELGALEQCGTQLYPVVTTIMVYIGERGGGGLRGEGVTRH